MTPKQATWLRLISTFLCIDAAIILTSLNGKLSATVIVLLIGAIICSRIKMTIEP